MRNTDHAVAVNYGCGIRCGMGMDNTYATVQVNIADLVGISPMLVGIT